MSVETRVLVNGEWVTRTVDLNTVLQHHEQQDIEASRHPVQVERAPVFGMLTQTVVQSPLVHHILPIKLRGLEFNDVAFIGEEFVQIKELRPDGFLWDLARKESFGARIRNARVVGSIEDYENDPDVKKSLVKDEDSDMGIVMETNRNEKPILPPQFLLLQLDTGDSVFLMLQQTGSATFEFIITGQHRVPRKMLNFQPGMHLSVDPSSRFMAVACSESHFIVYSLRSREQLKSQYTKGTDLQHIMIDAYLPFPGTIQKMEFLYPSTEGEGYIVLLILVTFKGRTRMMLYDWKLGDDIRHIRSLNRKGHLLAEAHQMPLLLIPLKFKSTFILVSENIMAHFQNILEGEPICTPFYDHVRDPPTSIHHGSGAPLWVGWARPVNRTRAHNDHRDDVYIAREDGLLKFLEIDCDDFVESDMNVGEFEGRCGTALACIDYRDTDNQTGDLLITGGDSCTGGAYLVQARQTPHLIQPIENWTPTQDFVTVSGDCFQSRHKARSKNRREIIPRPDRIFACVGKGTNGAIAEFRYGMEARIGLHFDYELPIMQAWALPFVDVAYGHTDGTLFLLSIGESSIALHLPADEASVEIIGSEMTKLDLDHQTIAVKNDPNFIIQVTENSVVLIDKFGSKKFESDQLLHIQNGGQSIGLGVALYDAVIDGRSIVYTTIIDTTTYLLLLDLTSSGDNSNNDPEQDGRTICQFSARVTCLATCWVETVMFVVVAEWVDDSATTTISFQAIAINSERIVLDLCECLGENSNVDGIESIVAVSSQEGLTLLCGTRSGVLLILEIDLKTFKILKSGHLRVGRSSVKVKKDEVLLTHSLFLAGCDTNTFALTFDTSHSGGLGRPRIRQIWFTDAQDPELLQPKVNSVIGHVPSFWGDVHDRLLVVAGTQLILASLDVASKAVPRYLKIVGTPDRMIYSHSLHVFIVAVTVDFRSTLLFIDPETGKAIGTPLERKGGTLTKFATGLGNLHERVIHLFDWAYVRGTNTWNFIIVGTSMGRLLIISAEDQARSENGAGSVNENSTASRPSISYYTKNKVRCDNPIYSVTGFDGGLIWCSGDTVYCHTLDLAEKRFKKVASYELPSFARTLEYSNGTIFALTQEHSLEVLSLEISADGSYEIVRKYGDQLSRYALNNVAIEQPEGRALHLISDKMRSFVGLWPTEDAIADTLETVFEGQVASSIVKFQTTKCRPMWDPSWNISNAAIDPAIPTSALASQEVLGLTIDGALCRFAILEPLAWKFLRFIINLCLGSRSICEFQYFSGPIAVEVVDEPKTMMHVDGDILQRCLRDQKLEELLQVGSVGDKAEGVFLMFVGLLQALHRDSLKEGAPPEFYIAQAYADLELYLRPML